MKVLLLLLLPSALLALRVRRQDTDKWWENIEPSTDVHGRADAPEKTSGALSSHDVIPAIDNHQPVTKPPQIHIEASEYCDGEKTKCVPYYDCDDPDVVVVGADHIPTIGKGLGGDCKLHLDVCCRNINPKGRTDPPHYTENHCSGQRNHFGSSVQVLGLGETDTNYGEFPWMMAILRIERIGKKEINLYVCGGSLIRDDVVLTAAHCVEGQPAKDLKIRGGEWDTQQDYETYPDQERRVSSVHIHPEYNYESLWNNFAVLILDTPFKRGPSINTICLPSSEEIFENRTTCFATGWGKDKFGKEGQFQHILKKVDVPYVPHTECEAALKETRLTRNFVLHESFMCAGGEYGKDTCTGDGGSPLVCNLPQTDSYSTYFQLGIVSWGIGCGEMGVPGVYADTRYGLKWIDSVLIQ